MNITSLEEQVTTLPVDLPDGGKITIKYRPGLYTPAFMDDMDDKSTHHMLGELLVETGFTIWKSHLEWHRREVERKKAILSLQADRRSLAEDDLEGRGRLTLEIMKLNNPESRPSSPVEGDAEVPLPPDVEALTILPGRVVNTLARAITVDQVPSRRRDADLDSSFSED
jgi:hypothetical protein